MSVIDNNMPDKQTVLIVDDVADNIMILDAILQDDYKVRVATSGEKAIAVAMFQQPPDIILLDVMMPDIDGFEVCRRLKAHEATRKIPIIFVTALGEVRDEAQGLRLGAVDYITKPVNPAIVQARVRTHLALYDQNRELETMVSVRTRDLELAQAEVVNGMQKVEHAQTEMLERLAQAAELRDDTTGQHTYRVGNLSALLAAHLGLSEAHSDMIRRTAPLHDVGKIGIADEILLKPARLTEEEFAIMRTHTTIGAAILHGGKSVLVRTAETIALTHHERWDGNGYPHHLQGNAIPLEGQIVAIADAFDTITHARPYKGAETIAYALAELDRCRDQHFSATLVDTFLSLPHARLLS